MSFGSVYIILTLVVVAAVVSPSSGTNETKPNCLFNSTDDCIQECFLSQPPSIVYLNEGDSIILSVDVNTDSKVFFTTFKDGTLVTDMNNVTLCDPKYCIFDMDSPRLEITSFNASFSVGSYRLSIRNLCDFPFNISQAVPPTLAKQNNNSIIFDNDEGPLVLDPLIYHGLPPGEVVWFRDGINISKGDTYMKEKVFAEDRGIYTAKIYHQAGNVSLDYNVTVNFPPIISLTTNPMDTNPANTNGPITVTCLATSHPIVESISLMSGQSSVGVTTIESIEQPDNSYEARVVYTINNGCPTQQFVCIVDNGPYKTTSEQITICQKAPNITMVKVDAAMSTNESVHLTWTLDPPNAVVMVYEVMYRLNGSEVYTTVTVSDTTNEYRLIEGLSPGLAYEFKVRAIDSSASTDDTFSAPILFTTFRRPVNRPTGVTVARNDTVIHLVWNLPSEVLSYAPVTGYDVFYHKGNSSAVKVSVDGDMTSYTLRSNIDSSLTYFFTVRATNEWGNGELSSEVEARKIIVVDPNPIDIEINLSIEISNDRAVLTWSIESERDSLSRLTITISRIESFMLNNVQFFDVATYNVTEIGLTEKCFSSLNSSETYQFCIQPHSNDGINLPETCQFGTTSNSDRGLTSDSGCVPVVPERLSGGSVIPSWAIAVIVVSAVGLVFVFFGGCGLYFGLKRNKKGELEYEGHNEAFDKMPNDGNYPYPPPPPRSVSPSRNCMSYRHNNHGHHLDWQGVTAV